MSDSVVWMENNTPTTARVPSPITSRSIPDIGVAGQFRETVVSFREGTAEGVFQQTAGSNDNGRLTEILQHELKPFPNGLGKRP